MHPLSESSDATAVNKASSSTLRCLITGANGMIGHALQAAARKRGIEAVPVQRPVTRQKGNLQQPTARPGTILWSPEAAHPFADLEALEGFDAVIHLAGANLSAHRWTAAYKKTILESRTLTTGALALALARLRQPPKVLLSASATGFYGSRGDEVLTEDSPKGSGFLSDVCQDWENATAPASRHRRRSPALRRGAHPLRRRLEDDAASLPRRRRRPARQRHAMDELDLS
jgi:NAD dependent epimerase/dehydratase family enzyme